METTRRSLLTAAAVSPALASLGALTASAAADPALDAAKAVSTEAHMRLSNLPGMKMQGSENIAMLLYPGFTALDLVGPHYFFGCLMGATVHLVTTQKSLAPVASDLGLAIAPTVTMQQCPAALDVLFAPGGTIGTLAAMDDKAVRAFVADRGARAKYITSVCTGAFVLAAAGLLRGRRATSHWGAREKLSLFGATPVDARVVHDGNFITGAGVSAGLDFAIAMVETLRGRPYAEALMLQAEYAPEPPFKGGTFATTGKEIANPSRDMLAPFRARLDEIAKQGVTP